jgi:integrase
LPRPKGVRAVARARPDGTREWHWYDRHSGARLPDPTDPRFLAALTEARRIPTGNSTGSIAEAVEGWLRSPDFKAKRPTTQAQRRLYIDALRRAQTPLAGLRRRTILDWRDVVIESRGPGAGQQFVAVVRTFLSWCVDRGMIDANPALRIATPRGGTLKPWTEAEAQQAMKAFPEPARRAVVLAYHLGQRRGDLTQITWDNVDLARGQIRLQQEKAQDGPDGRAWMVLPIPPALKLELQHWKLAPLGNARPMRAPTVLTTPRGMPWIRSALSVAIKRAVTKAGMRAGLNLHGLRKLLAADIAEAGGTVKEIAAVTGHRTLGMVAHYTASADQERMADAAIVRLSNRRKPQ